MLPLGAVSALAGVTIPTIMNAAAARAMMVLLMTGPFRLRARSLSGVGRRSPDVVVAAGAEQRAGEHGGGDPDQPVDDPAGDVGLTEVLAEQPRDEVELRQGDETPVETTDDHKGGGDGNEFLHGIVLSLSNVCRRM